LTGELRRRKLLKKINTAKNVFNLVLAGKREQTGRATKGRSLKREHGYSCPAGESGGPEKEGVTPALRPPVQGKKRKKKNFRG